jgi:hypothetical protein
VSANVTSYHWSTGATTPTLAVTQPGAYPLTLASAQVRVSSLPPVEVALPPDSALCANSRVVLHPRRPGPDV